MYSKSLLKSHGWDERAHTVWKVGDVLSDSSGYWVLHLRFLENLSRIV